MKEWNQTNNLTNYKNQNKMNNDKDIPNEEKEISFEEFNIDEATKMLNSEKVEDINIGNEQEPEFFDIHDVREDTENISEPIKNNIYEPKVGGERKTAHTEARMLVSILDIFFGKVFTLISGTSNDDKWRLKQQDKADIIDIATEWFKEEGLMSPKAMFILAIVLIFTPMAAEAVAERIKRNRNKKKGIIYDEELDGDIIKQRVGNKVIYINPDDLPKRRNFTVDGYGRYIFDGANGRRLNNDERLEEMEAKDYENLIKVNSKDFIDSWFRDRGVTIG